MIDMLKRHEIQVLRPAGHTLAEVATLSGVSGGTVRGTEAEAAVTAVDSDAEQRRREIGRLSKAEAYREALLAALTDDGRLSTSSRSNISSRSVDRICRDRRGRRR